MFSAGTLDTSQVSFLEETAERRAGLLFIVRMVSRPLACQITQRQKRLPHKQALAYLTPLIANCGKSTHALSHLRSLEEIGPAMLLTHFIVEQFIKPAASGGSLKPT
ncbi:MAG: hypothetical protein CMM01_18505 [Rhodopirellula sp.]|nr:hypothetical protein [Rhodopirellula sp.]